MKKLLLLVLAILFVSCGQENIGTNNVSDNQNSDILTEQDSSSSELADNPFYEDVVDEIGHEASQEEEEEIIADNPTEEEQSEQEYVDFPGTIYRSKAGEIVFTDETGAVLKMDELSAVAQSQLEEIKFPQDSFEVNLKGERVLSSIIKQTAFADINTRVPGIGTNYHFYVDSVDLLNQITHPERAEETSYATSICGELSIDSYNASESNLYSLLLKESSTSTTYVVTAEYSGSDLSDLYKLEELIQSVSSTTGGVTNGCIYSNDSIYNNYSATWRKLINLHDFTINW